MGGRRGRLIVDAADAGALDARMPRFYPVSIDLDGRKTGEWALLLGGQIRVRSAWGNKAGPCGKDAPEVAAKRVLGEIVRDWQRQRQREARQLQREGERLTRGGRPRNPSHRTE
jgi:hypothetical protein